MTIQSPGSLIDAVLEADASEDSETYSPRDGTDTVTLVVQATGAGTVQPFVASPLAGASPIAVGTASNVTAGGNVISLTNVTFPFFVRATDTSSSANRITVAVYDNGD